MPFTFVHPIAIIPIYKLSKKKLDIVALAIGSVSPDFEYFIRFRLKSDYSHDLILGILFNLPIAIIIYLISKSKITEIILKHTTQKCHTLYSNIEYKNKWVVFLSIILGMYTHILWDTLTHFNPFTANNFTLLSKQINFGDSQVNVYRILQHLSNLLGATVGSYLFYKKIMGIETQNNSDTCARKKILYWTIVVVIISTILLLNYLLNQYFNSIGNIVVIVISSLLISLTFTSVIFLIPFLLKNKL